MTANSCVRSFVLNPLSAAKSVLVIACILALAIPAMADRRNNPNVYVGNVNGNTISVIDSRNNKVVATIDNIFFPFCAAISPDGRRLYIGHGSGGVTVIDALTKQAIASISTPGESTALAVAPDGKRAYVADGGANSVSVIDTMTNTLSRWFPLLTIRLSIPSMWARRRDRW